ncbi:MAG TPA: MBL fold metallo-hydrolase [Acidimicrobiia bacterium]|nr:MBL fold metallo-hydrolase [Acidimicrobiia bacterium]
MIFEQFYLGCLSHASYLVGDEAAGRAVVVDPQRDIAEYVRTAEAHGLTIERVIETHVHADFVSGHLELAARTGAVISYGDALGDTDFAVETLADGERLELGRVVLEIRATPGHTPESISVVVFDGASATEPFAVLTGDTLFVGDVGRPDLLASLGSDADTLARQLYHSLHDRLLTLPDTTLVYPAHGAGSACGKHLSTETSSTIGEQRRTNYALQPMTEDEFVATVTEGQSVAPPYFLFDAGQNRADRPLLDEQAPPPPMTIDEVLAAAADGAALLDTREPADFANGHVAGAYGIGLQGRFSENVGALLAAGRPIVLVGDPAHATEAKVRLARIGYDVVLGALDDLFGALESRPAFVEHGSVLTVAQLAEAMGRLPDLQLVDVRNPREIVGGTVRGARVVPLPVLMARTDELDPDRPTVMLCASGYRSAIAASALAASGFADVSTLLGGVDAWRGAGLALTTEQEEPMSISEVGAEEADELIGSGAYLLDVREADEWASGHAPAATWIRVADVAGRIDDLPRGQQILAICRSGGRSSAVTETLVGAGLDAANVVGGMQAWARAGLDIVADDGAVGSVI